MKKYIKVAAVLGGIALVCAVLIAAMNLITAPIIESNRQKTISETYKAVYSDYSKGEAKEYNTEAKYITEKLLAYDSNDNALGYIYTVSGKNSYGEISLMIGISNGRVVDVEFLKNTESFASTVNSHLKENYPSSNENVIKLDPYSTDYSVSLAELDSLDGIDVKCGATYGATLIKNMVNEALEDAKGGK